MKIGCVLPKAMIKLQLALLNGSLFPGAPGGVVFLLGFFSFRGSLRPVVSYAAAA